MILTSVCELFFYAASLSALSSSTNFSFFGNFSLRSLSPVVIALLCWAPPSCIVIWKLSLRQKFRAMMGLLLCISFLRD